MSHFPQVQLRRAFKIVNGGTPTADAENWDGDFRWATPADLAPVNGGILNDTSRKVTRLGLDSGSAAVPAGSLIVSTRAPIGYVAQVSDFTAFNQGCRGLVPSANTEVRYFRYQCVSLLEELQSRGQGSTFVELSTEGLASTPVLLPPIGHQRAIADYLDTETARIDALIKKKRRMVELLEDHLRLMAYELTTSSGDASPLRRCIRQVKTGTTPPAEALDRLSQGEVPWYSPGDVGTWLEIKPAVRTLTAEALDDGFVPLFPAESTLIVGIGATAGKVAHLNHDGTGNQQMTCLVPLPTLHPRFLSWQLFARSDELRSTAPFTTLPILNNDFLKSVSLFLPDMERQGEAVQTLDYVADRTRVLTERIEGQTLRLIERRQAVITAAVTGELDIPGVAA